MCLFHVIERRTGFKDTFHGNMSVQRAKHGFMRLSPNVIVSDATVQNETAEGWSSWIVKHISDWQTERNIWGQRTYGSYFRDLEATIYGRVGRKEARVFQQLSLPASGTIFDARYTFKKPRFSLIENFLHPLVIFDEQIDRIVSRPYVSKNNGYISCWSPASVLENWNAKIAPGLAVKLNGVRLHWFYFGIGKTNPSPLIQFHCCNRICCLLPHFTHGIHGGIGAPLHFLILLSRIMNRESEQRQSAQGNNDTDYNGTPIGPRFGEKWRAAISASLMVVSLFPGFCGFWLVYTSGRVEDICVINIPRIIGGFALIGVFWIAHSCRFRYPRYWSNLLGALSCMKQREYIEGPEALEKFERGMIALFKVPKTAIGKARKKGRKLTAPRKKKRSDDKD